LLTTGRGTFSIGAESWLVIMASLPCPA